MFFGHIKKHYDFCDFFLLQRYQSSWDLLIVGLKIRRDGSLRFQLSFTYLLDFRFFFAELIFVKLWLIKLFVPILAFQGYKHVFMDSLNIHFSSYG